LAPVTALAMAAGILVLIPFAAAEGLFTAPLPLSPGGWVVLLFLAGPAGALGFFMWNWALRRIAPTSVAVFLPLSPVIAAALGAWLLDEVLGPRFVAGLSLVVIGIWCAVRPSRLSP